MSPAFWDSSSLVPFCVEQAASDESRALIRRYSIVVWWGTVVEIRSALERLLRMGALTEAEHAGAGLRLDQLRGRWREMQPTDVLRAQAEKLLQVYPLTAADALQLAAASVWRTEATEHLTFITGDAHLLDAAGRFGFQVVGT